MARPNRSQLARAKAIARLTPPARLVAVQRAEGEAYLWASAVVAMADRLRESLQTSPEYQADQRLLIMALKQTVRAAEMARDLTTSDHKRAEIVGALDELDDVLSRAGVARNLIEHFDAYLLGYGWMEGHTFSQPQVRSTMIQIGSIEVEVDQAERAAARLASAVIVPVPPDQRR